MTRSIDKRTALRLLTKAVKANPTKVAACTYAKVEYSNPYSTDKTVTPECVAGVIFDGLGISVLALEQAGGTVESFQKVLTGQSVSFDSGVQHLIIEAFGDVRMSKSAARLLQFAQATQDGRHESAFEVLNPDYKRPGWDSTEVNQRDAYSTRMYEKFGDSAIGGHAPWSDVLALTVENYDKF